MSKFKFNLKQQVKIAASGEQGKVVGRAEYTNAGNAYLIEYQAADGRATTAWWAQTALVAVPVVAKKPRAKAAKPAAAKAAPPKAASTK